MTKMDDPNTKSENETVADTDTKRGKRPDKYETMKDLNGAIYSDDSNIRWKFKPEDVVILGLDEVIEDTDDLYDDGVKTKLDDNMVANVKSLGVMQDIMVTPRVVDGVLKPCVVAGRNRTRWARAANKGAREEKRVAIHAHNATEKQLADAVSAKHAENYGRVTRTIQGRAKAAADLKSKGKTNEEIAIALGVSVSSIENFLALDRASKPLKDALAKGTIQPTAAYKLAKMPEDKQADALKQTMALAKADGGKARVGHATAGKARTKGDKPEANKRPGVSKIRRILEAVQSDPAAFKSLAKTEPVDFLRWILGDVTERVLQPELRELLKKRKRSAPAEE